MAYHLEVNVKLSHIECFGDHHEWWWCESVCVSLWDTLSSLCHAFVAAGMGSRIGPTYSKYLGDNQADWKTTDVKMHF